MITEKTVKILIDLGYDKKQLSKEIGISERLADTILTSQTRNLKISEYLKICEAIGINPETIFNRKSQQPEALYESNQI